MQHDERERVYGRNEYYWGTEPNELAKRTLDLISPHEDNLTLVDIGAGEGRDTVFFAENGIAAHAVDVSSNGLAKAQRLADDHGVEIDVTKADANTLELSDPVDVVYSVGTVQYIEPAHRQHQFEHFRRQTVPGGLHVVFAFIDHPDIPTPPDWTENEYFYNPSELKEYYDDWSVLDFDQIIFEDDSGEVPHKHAAEIVFAEKPS